MTEIGVWPVFRRSGLKPARLELTGIATVAPAIDVTVMPPEVAILLPSTQGPQEFAGRIAGAVGRPGGWPAEIAVGLFLGDPFLAAEREARRLLALGVRWVCNLPTVAQQDAEFTQQLADVGLDAGREMTALAAFKDAGLNVLVVVTSSESARAAAEAGAHAIAVFPHVADFAAGFPSPRQRGASAKAVHDALHEMAWQGPLFGYGDRRESAHESQWPEFVDGIIAGPALTPLAELTG